MPQAAPLLPGDPARVGPYRLVGRLGEGGQGTVFLAEDDSGAQVALKLLHARLTGDAKARSRFAAELSVARRVAAFCTARVLDADVEGQTPYIVSEFIDGPSLQTVVAAEGPRAGPALVRIAIGTSTALAAIHDAGVVHRDFKPSNVLIAPDGPRLIDFGIARALDATGTLSSTAVGTPAYMAPEQIAGHRVGPEADVFAWGAAMVHAATGRGPFGQDSIPAVMHRILNLPPDLGALTGPLRDIVATCLAKDPAQRPSAQTVLLHLLHHAGALPQSVVQGGARPDTVLLQGAEVAAAATPPALGEIAPPPGSSTPWSGLPPGAPPPPPLPNGGWTPPPWPGPHGTAPAVDLQKQPTSPLGRPPGRGRGIGVLAGAAAAAIVATALIGAFVIVRLGDDSGSDDGARRGRVGGELTMTTFAPTAVDPSSAGWGADRTIVKQLFTGLVEVTPEGAPRNRLATAVEPADGCRRWTIRMRTGTTFGNGEPVDAEALLRGWSRAAQSEGLSAPALMDDIEGYEQARRPGGTFSGPVEIDDGGAVVRLRLSEPDCDFAKRLADPVFFPVPRSAGAPDDSGYNNRPVGNGPFTLSSYTPNKEAVLVRNDSWAFGKAPLDRVVVKFVSNAEAALAGLRSGQTDWVEIGTESLPHARTLGGDHALLTRPSDGAHLLIPIAARGPMSKREARQAVSLALDRKRLSQLLTAGFYPPSTGLVPTGLQGFAQGGACPDCSASDPARARRLAEQAGLKAGAKVPLVVRQGSIYHRWAEAVAGQLESVLGWDVQIDAVETADYAERLAGDDITGLVMSGWLPDYPSAHSFLQSLLGGDQRPGEGGNYARWRDEEFDRLLEQARTTADQAEAAELLQAAERIAVEDKALIPLWNLANVRLASKRFTGLQMDFQGDPTLATAALR